MFYLSLTKTSQECQMISGLDVKLLRREGLDLRRLLVQTMLLSDIPNAEFQLITTFLNRSTYHKNAVLSLIFMGTPESIKVVS